MAGFECVQLHHVAVVVDDLAAARAFYRDALGLNEIERPAVPVDGFWLGVGDAQVHVVLGDAAAPGRHHFALEVTDLDAAIAALEAAGYASRRFPLVAGAGRQAGVRDPAGNLVELRQSV
jgi:glyoxylase I family protein